MSIGRVIPVTEEDRVDRFLDRDHRHPAELIPDDTEQEDDTVLVGPSADLGPGSRYHVRGPDQEDESLCYLSAEWNNVKREVVEDCGVQLCMHCKDQKNGGVEHRRADRED